MFVTASTVNFKDWKLYLQFVLGQLLVPLEDLVAEGAGNDPALVLGLYVLLEVVCLGVSLLALVAVVVELHRPLLLPLQLALSAHVDL